MELQRKSISSSFTTDLISEILLRLPEKSVVRFRCVSKIWLSITTDPYFINLFETRSPRPSLLVFFNGKEDNDFIVSSIPQHTFSLDQNSRNSHAYSQPIPTHTCRMKLSESRHYCISTDSVHGLICLRTSTEAIVWNPSTSKFLTLPKPSKRGSNIPIFLGYDAVEAKHKVIAMDSRKTSTVCWVITLGSAQESWRIVKTTQNHRPYNHPSYGQCIKGVIYYLASTCETTYKHDRLIMRFDVRSEKLDTIELPTDSRHVNRLITYEGKLALLYKEDSSKKNGITLSILEDAEESKWSSKDFLAPFDYTDQSLQINFQLRGFTHGGEFIYEPFLMYKNRKSVYVLFFDPVRNSFRRVGFEGIPYEERRGWGFLYIFPNHIDSQMSL